jgi:hypothetical protein
VNCHFALEQKRYTWRHDSVLANIEVALRNLVEKFNSKKPTVQVKWSKDTMMHALTSR